MANSYPTAIRAPNARGLGTFTVPRAANDNVRQYVQVGRSPVRLVPANDNVAVRPVGVPRGVWKTAVGLVLRSPIAGILSDAVHVALDHSKTESIEVPNFSAPASPAPGFTWVNFGTLEAQCAVPNNGVLSGTGTINCSANAGAPTPYPTYSQFIDANQALISWRIDVREFIDPATQWRFRQRFHWQLRQQWSTSPAGSWWSDYYPDGPPIVRKEVVRGPALAPLPQRWPRAVPTPKQAPEWRWQGPSAGPRAVATVPPARPPGPNVRERKMIVAIHGVPARLINFATETLDFVDAIHGALPKELQARPRFIEGRWVPPSPVDKAMAVYNNLDRLDLRQALINLLLEQFEDAVYGGIGSLSRRSLRGNRYYRRPVGWQAGPAF